MRRPDRRQRQQGHRRQDRHPTRTPHRLRSVVAIVVAGLVPAAIPGTTAAAAVPAATASAATPAVAAPTATPAPSTSGTTPAVPGVPAGRWTAVPVRGGTRVTLRLDAPLPTRDAAVGLAVDGVPVPGARAGTGDRVISVVTAAPRARRPTRVEVTLNGRAAAPVPPTAPRRLAAAPPADVRGSTATGDPVTVDPAGRGDFGVQRLDYDLGDTAVALPGLGGRRVEERAAVYAPVGAPGRRPVVIFLHGRHEACFTTDGEDTSTSTWPCPRGARPVPSNLGYGAPATTLASHGYVVVSISADGVNALDGSESYDGGAQARGELVMAHLDLLAAADAGRVGGRIGAAAHGRLDLTHIGLMGHSRGGEGVVRAAAINAARPHPYGIRGVLPLASTDFSRAALPGIATAVVLPYCDGDVTDLQGQHLFDDSRYADAGDDVLRASLLVMGANHNFFNTEWTPGRSVAPSVDDWFIDDDPTCGTDTGNRLTPARQEAVGTAYLAGFFRLTIGGERSMLPLFDGSAGRATSAGGAVVWTSAQAPRRDRVDVAGLEDAPAAYRLSGPVTATRCASLVVPGTPRGTAPAPCVQSYSPERWPSFTPAALVPNVPATPVVDLRWTGAGARAAVTVPAAARDIRRFDALTLRLSPDGISPDAPARPADLAIGVVDGHGRAVDVPVSGLSAALGALPGGEPFLGKRWLRTVRVPLSRLGGLDLSDVRQVRLTALSATGTALVSDVAFSRSALGTGGARLPVVSVTSARLVPVGRGSVVRATVRLSAPAPRPVRVSAQVLPTEDILVRTAATTLTIPAGATSATADYPVLYPPGEPSGYGDGLVVLADQTNAVMGTQNVQITRR